MSDDRSDKDIQLENKKPLKGEKKEQKEKSHRSRHHHAKSIKDDSYDLGDNQLTFLVIGVIYVLGLVVAGPEAAHLYFVESVGTFFLVFTIGNVVIEPGAGPLAPIPIGSCLMVMIYAGGHVSGGHFNPAVSFGCWVRGALATKHLVPYIVYQILGSIIASNLVLYIQSKYHVGAQEVDVGRALLAEFLGTFALVWVVLHTATDHTTQGNSNYGLAIGTTVTVMAFSLGGVSGGAFNPAVAIGAALMRLIQDSQVWIHLMADFAGGFAAGVAYRLVTDVL